MQNKYVADIGDFGKYGLLRFLSGATSDDDSPALKLGLIWYLYHDDNCNNDGRHTSYVKRTPTEDKSEFRDCDPELWEGLRDLVMRDARCIHCAEQANLLPEGTCYSGNSLHFTIRVPRQMRVQTREPWWQGALLDTKDADLVCVDPDNGLTGDEKMYLKNGPKFTYVPDLKSLWNRGQSLVVYHHLGMNKPGADQVREVGTILKNELEGEPTPVPLWFSRGTARLFFVIPRPEHEELLVNRVRSLTQSPWGTHEQFREVELN